MRLVSARLARPRSEGDTVTDEPLAHILRPNPPWRNDTLTECGKRAADVAKTVTADAAMALWTKHGRQRASFLLCMTCMPSLRRHSYGRTEEGSYAWSSDPVAVLVRYVALRSMRDDPEVIAELHAVGALIEAHREEFDAYVAGVLSASSLTAARARHKKRVGR